MINNCPKEKIREVPAEEILDQIHNGVAVDYDCVIIKGHLDLNKLTLPTKRVELSGAQKGMGLSDIIKIVDTPISIKTSSIEGKLDFSNILFQESVTFSDVEFDEDADFKGV